MHEILLLDHQADFVEDDETRHLLLVAGYGAGKTYGFISKAIDLAHKNIGHVGILLEPTVPLLHDILIPDMETYLQDAGIPYTFVKTPQPNLTIHFDEGDTKIRLRSLENWKRLIGANAAFIGLDEFDTLKKEEALKAYKKLQGRLRRGNVRQMFSATTPEGFGAAYELFEKQKIGRIIRARTEDNPFLPADFIQDLKDNYPPNLLKAYLEGLFVNLTTGTVYSYFDRVTHGSAETVKEGETIYVGQDFNVGGCVSIICVQRGNEFIAADEIISHDTRGVISNIQNRYPSRRVEIFPDASGQNRKTNASDTDVQLLRQAGFSVYVNAANPSIKDRVNTVNTLFYKSVLRVNADKCPQLTAALEQQAYDRNGDPIKGNAHPEPSDFNDALGYLICYKFPIAERATIRGGVTAGR